MKFTSRLHTVIRILPFREPYVKVDSIADYRINRHMRTLMILKAFEKGDGAGALEFLVVSRVLARFTSARCRIVPLGSRIKPAVMLVIPSSDLARAKRIANFAIIFYIASVWLL